MKSRAMTHKVFLQVFLLSTLWLTVLTTSTASASGTTYYVAPSGNDSNPGTEANPWLTIQKAADTAQAGDTVYIKAGIYNEQVIVKNSGSVNNYISFISYPGNSAIIDGSGIDLGDWAGLFQINDKSYIKISGLQIRNSVGGIPGPAGILVLNSNHIIIENNFTYNTKSSGIGVWYSSNVVVDGNDVRRAVNGGSQECITVSETSNFEVRNNTVHDGVGLYLGGEGIDIKQACAYGRVYNNRIYDLPGEVGFYIDAYSSKYPNHLHDIELYNNIVSAPEGIALGAEQGGHIENIKVYNNIVYDGSSHGIVVTAWVGENEGTKKNVEIVNNTVYNCGQGTWGGGIRVESEKVENIIINNNIVSENARWQISVKPAARPHVSVSNNLIDEFRNGYEEIYGDSYVEGNPRFVNSAERDFHLMSDSPAIDVGTLANAPATDYDGNHRPQGTGYDIGAYEYGGTATPSPSPSPDEIIIDNTDARFSTSFSQDAWQDYIQAGGQHYGDSHYYNREIGSSQDTATWSFTVSKSGNYDIYAWWWEGDWRPSDVPYTIHYHNGAKTVRVNQQVNGGQWNLLGNFYIQDVGSVIVFDDVLSGKDIVADAIRLVYRSEGPPVQTQVFLPIVSK